MMRSEDQERICARNGLDYLKSTLSNAISSDTRTRIDTIIREVSSLKDVEKLLFCLLFPVDGGSHSFGTGMGFSSEPESVLHGFEMSSFGVSGFSPGGPSALHLSNQVEQSQAYTWIMSHLEEDPSTCLRKDEVYDDYRAYCDKHHMKTLNTADFGKVMKRAFPNVKPRRLGQRGQSRYCYGGMRKKVEVQPPFLPDLTDETLGFTSHYLTNRMTTSPGSSSGASGDIMLPKRSHINSPAPGSLNTNGVDSQSTNWVDELSVRTSLGARGPIVADLAQVLLEYTQQVFGLQFQSLFHLAQHLVINRYVNTRSRHALSLIAHSAATHPTSFSPPPSAALVDVLQKGIGIKSAFDRVSNNRSKLGTLDRSSSMKMEDDLQLKGPTPATTDLSQAPNRFHTTSKDSPLHTLSPSVAFSVGGSVVSPSTNSTVNRTYSMLQPCGGNIVAVADHGMTVCSASQPCSVATYRPGVPSQYSLGIGTRGLYSAAALASPSRSGMQTSPLMGSHYPEQSTDLHHSATTSAGTGSSHQQHSTNPLHQHRYASHTTEYLVSSLNTSNLAQVSPTQVNMLTPPVAHGDKTPSFPPPSTPDPPVYRTMSYVSPLPSSSMYAAHQQTSPYSNLHQPPAPLPPGVGARSPYTPVGNPASVATSDLGQANFGNKRAPLRPVEAPGAYEPSPRFHLGGQSPNKRARYVSTASNSSGSVECPTLVGSDIMDPYQDHSSGMLLPSSTATESSPVSSNGSSASAKHVSGGTSYSGSGRAVPHHIEQSTRIPSPFYPGRYEGLEMRSPAPPTHVIGHQSSGSHRLPVHASTSFDTGCWGVSNANIGGSGGGGSVSYQTENSLDYGTGHARQNFASSMHSSVNAVFRPPVTPFTLDLEDDEDGLTNLPRLGTSPGPQIPPSSPTEFLPFYSEAASKSRQKQSTTTPRTHISDTEDCTAISDNASSHSTSGCTDAPIVSLETPPASTLVSSGHGLHPIVMSPPTSPCGSDNSQDRTLTNFDQYDEVTVPLMPGGLASVPSPSESIDVDSVARNREDELSTPGPVAEPTHAVANNAESADNVARKSATDVSITAF